MNRLPLAQSESLVIRWVENELVVVDQTDNVAHCLSEQVARVFMRCNGTTRLEDIAATENLSLTTVHLAVDELARTGLLVTASVTRRQFSSRVAKTTAAAVAMAPVIYSLAIPGAAAAASLQACQNVDCSANGSNRAAAIASANRECTGAAACDGLTNVHCSIVGSDSLTPGFYGPFGHCTD